MSDVRITEAPERGYGGGGGHRESARGARREPRAHKSAVCCGARTVLGAVVVAWRFADELGGDEGATARAGGDVARESGGGVARTLTAAAV